MVRLPEISQTHHMTCLKVDHFLQTRCHEAEARESLVQEKLQKYAKPSSKRRKIKMSEHVHATKDSTGEPISSNPIQSVAECVNKTLGHSENPPCEKDITNISMEQYKDMTYDIKTCFWSGLTLIC